MDDNDKLVNERLVSIECGRCGRGVTYSGTGRWPRYCSQTCRSRAWEQRRAAEQLDHPDPTPTVVREVRERVVDRRIPTPVEPATAAEWTPLLRRLSDQLRDDPAALSDAPQEEFAALASEAWRVNRLAAAHSPTSRQPQEWPETATGWTSLLRMLCMQLRFQRSALAGPSDDFAALIAVTTEVYQAAHRLDGDDPAPPVSPDKTTTAADTPRLSRQQRRALERKQRKH